MATYYATGSGTWNSTNLNIWYLDAARTIPATTVPTSADDVEFDASTTNITVPSSAQAVCRNMAVRSTWTGAMTYTSSLNAPSVYGNFVYECKSTSLFPVKMFTNNSTVNCVNNTYTSLSIYPQTGVNINLTSDCNIYTIVGGTTTTNNYSLTTNSTLNTILNAGTSIITACTNKNSFTCGAGSSVSSANITVYVYSDLVLNGNTFGTLSLIGTSTTTLYTIPPHTAANLTITGGFYDLSGNITATNLTLAGTLTNRTLLTSNVEFARRTLTVNGTLSVSNTILRNITGAGSASWNLSGSNDVGNGGYNSDITFPAPRNIYWVGIAGGNWNDTANWSPSSGGVSGVIPLPQDVANFDANSITSGGRSITIGHYLLCGEIQSVGLLNTPTLTTTALDVRFLKSIDLSGFGTLNSNKIWYYYNEGDVSIKGSGSQTIFDLRPSQTINVLFKLSFKSNFTIIDLWVKNYIDCEDNIVTTSNTIITNSPYTKINANTNGKLVVITTIGVASDEFEFIGNGVLELGGSGSPVFDTYTASAQKSYSISNLQINCTGTADLRRSVASTNLVAFNINKLIFAQDNKALTFYGEGGANGNVRLIIGEIVPASGNTLQATNGQGRVSITTTNKNKSKVLNFGNANLTNIAAQERNTVYATGTITNCTGIINRIPRLVAKLFFGTLARTKIGGFFNSTDFNNHEI